MNTDTYLANYALRFSGTACSHFLQLQDVPQLSGSFQPLRWYRSMIIPVPLIKRKDTLWNLCFETTSPQLCIDTNSFFKQRNIFYVLLLLPIPCTVLDNSFILMLDTTKIRRLGHSAVNYFSNTCHRPAEAYKLFTDTLQCSITYLHINKVWFTGLFKHNSFSRSYLRYSSPVAHVGLRSSKITSVYRATCLDYENELNFRKRDM